MTLVVMLASCPFVAEPAEPDVLTERVGHNLLRMLNQPSRRGTMYFILRACPLMR